MGSPRNYPRFPTRPPDLSKEGNKMWDALAQWWGRNLIEMTDHDALVIEGPAGREKWNVSITSPVYDFNVTSATDTYLAARLGTLLFDLKSKGVTK